MSQTDSPEHKAKLGHEPLPRLVELGEELLAFEGLTATLGHDGNETGSYSRSDDLIIPQLAGMVIGVTWRNYNNAVVEADQVSDPFDPIRSFVGANDTAQVFSATLEVAPKTLDAAWREQEDTFELSYKAAQDGVMPKKEFTDLLISTLAENIKLELRTWAGTSIGRAVIQPNKGIFFNQFRPYTWEMFSEDAPEPKHLYVPKAADLEKLYVRLSANDPHFGGTGQRPLVGGLRA